MERFNFSKSGEQLINLMVDHERKAPLGTCFSSQQGRKDAINAKFFEVLGGKERPTENDLEDHIREVFAIIREVASQTLTNERN